MLAYKHGATHKEIDAGKYPTNEQIVQALQLKVAKSVDIATRYRRVLWYSVFVTVYLVVLYLQASAYKSADVVSTLRNALMVDGQLSMTFSNEDEVLAYIGNKILLPTWKDPVCGDGAPPLSAGIVICLLSCFLWTLAVCSSPVCTALTARLLQRGLKSDPHGATTNQRHNSIWMIQELPGPPWMQWPVSSHVEGAPAQLAKSLNDCRAVRVPMGVPSVWTFWMPV